MISSLVFCNEEFVRYLRWVALSHTGYKVLVEEGTDRILGAHLLGLHAEEVINAFALAMRTGQRSQVDGLRLPHERDRCELHGMIATADLSHEGCACSIFGSDRLDVVWMRGNPYGRLRDRLVRLYVIGKGVRPRIF
jgi:Pyridine nucleotide-disulphide oxidoreductase, dimerisation domain